MDLVDSGDGLILSIAVLGGIAGGRDLARFFYYNICYPSIVKTAIPKLVSLKISPARPILAEKCFQNWFPRTTFAAKISPAGPILVAKTGPPFPILVPL